MRKSKGASALGGFPDLKQLAFKSQKSKVTYRLSSLVLKFGNVIMQGSKTLTLYTVR
jgi:hypothetical protein